MGGHGGLNILPQKRWNVYNFENREKVRRDEEAAVKEEQLKREQSRKRDAEFRLQQLRRARGMDPLPAQSSATVVGDSLAAAGSPAGHAVPVKLEAPSESDSKHINLFHGIKIFDPADVGAGGIGRKKSRVEGEEEEERKRKKMKKEATPRVVGPEDEKYRLGYGVAGRGVKAPWYMMRSRFNDGDEEDVEEEEEHRHRSGNRVEEKNNVKKKLKSLEGLREERLKREKKEKERERAFLMGNGQRRSDGGGYRDRYYYRR